MAGDGGGDAVAARFSVFRLLLAIRNGENFFDHALKFAAFEADRGCFNSDRLGAEGFGLEAVALKFVGETGEGDHLRRKKVDQERHEKALALNLFHLAVAEDLLEENALVGYVLVDDPEAFVVDGEDEGVAKLAEGTECSESVESPCFGIGFECGFIVSDRNGWFVKGEAAGGGRNGDGSKGEGVDVGGGWRGLGSEAGWRELRVEHGSLGTVGERAHVDEERGGGEGCVVQRLEEVGGWTRVHKRGADGIADEVVDEGRLAEANLGLGGMNVDIDLFGRHLEEEEDDGVGGGRNDVAVCLGECVEYETVADDASVDEDVDGIAIEFL